MALRYYHEYRDRGNHLHRVEIHSDTVSGGTELITTSTGEPVYTRHAGSRDQPKIIQGKEIQFSFYVFDYDHNKYDDIIESDFKDFYVIHYIDGNQEFYGWVNPENLSREHFKEAYVFRLSATDGLAWLKDVDFRDSNDDIIKEDYSLLILIKAALDKIGIELDFCIQLGTYETTRMTSVQCALDKIKARGLRFITGNNEPMSCYKVIETCLKIFNCTLKQHKGYYQITNKHELNSYQFIFDWDTLTQQSRIATDKIVNLAGYFYERADLNKIHPVKEFGITWKNKDLGGDITGVDLSDWDSSWTITFDNYTEGPAVSPRRIAAGEVEMNSGTGWEGDYVELASDFSVTKESEEDYIIISFTHRCWTDIQLTIDNWPIPYMKIEVKRPDGFWYPIKSVNCQIESRTYQSGPFVGFRVVESGDYNIRVGYYRVGGPDPPIDLYFYLKDFTINKIHNPAEIDEDEIANIVLDEYYLQTADKNVGRIEAETLLADSNTSNQLGGLLFDSSNTIAWNSYGNSEEIKILDIWARNELNDRYQYKDFMKLAIHDIENILNMDSILLIEGKYYTFVSFNRNEKKCTLDCDIVELLTDKQSYNTILYDFLRSVDGDDLNPNPNTVTPSTELPFHNDLQFIQGGAAPWNYYHLIYDDYIELTNWLDNVVLSDAGGIDMDDILNVDTINEHTADNGIDAESVHLENGGITLGTGPAVDTIETALTDDDSHLPTSGAVYDAIDTAIGVEDLWDRAGTVLTPKNSGDSIEMSDSASIYPDTDNTGGIGSSSKYWSIGYFNQLLYRRESADISTAFRLYSNTVGHVHQDYIYRYGGTIASPAAAPNGAYLRYVRGYAYDGTSLIEITRETTRVLGNVATNNVAGELQWSIRGAGVAAPLTTLMKLNENGLSIDNINEYTGTAGVTIDGLLIKDQNIGTQSLYQGIAYLTGWDLRDEATDINNYIRLYSNTAGDTCQQRIFRYGGTIASPAAAPTSASLKEVTGYAYDGAALRAITKYIIKVDGSVASDNVAGKHWWYVRPSGVAASLTLMMSLSTNGLTLKTGATVDTIETTLTDDATHIANSAAIYAAIAGASPAAHHTTHENGGSDEIDVTDLSGLLADGQTPLSHTHGNITNAGAIGSTANLPIITTTSGVLTVGSFGTGANTFCQGNDSRLSDARTPTAHAASHQSGGGDTINHDSLTGFVSDEHFDHTGITIGTAATSGLNGGGAISGSLALVLAVDRLTAVTTLQTTDYFPFYDNSGSGTRRISYANLITELEDDINHDNLTDFVANEHINHTSVSIATAATSGLNGGGTIASTRNLVLAVDRLTAVTTLQTTDYFPFYDNSGSGTRRISYANFLNELNGDLSVGIDMTNGVNNRVCTAVDADTINGEENLTFDGSILTVTGDIDCTRFNTESYGLKMIGINTGDSNTCYIGLYESNGTTRQGYMGIMSSTNDDLYITAESGKLLLQSSSGISITGDIYADGIFTVVDDNATASYWTLTNNSDTGIARFTIEADGGDAAVYFQVEPDGDGKMFDETDNSIILWDNDRRVSCGRYGVIDTQSGFTAFNQAADEFGATVQNADTGTTSYGLKIKCGASSQSSNIYVYLSAQNQGGSEEGGLRNNEGTFEVYQGSDQRLKANIADTQIDATKILTSLHVRDYNRIGIDGQLSSLQTGWIAQEVAEIWPAMHAYIENSDLHTISPTQILPVLHRGWQIHEERIETQQQKINRMERHIIQLENKLKKYENKINRT